jgi:16S rRNA (guanine527-N7)-methyltransferase
MSSVSRRLVGNLNLDLSETGLARLAALLDLIADDEHARTAIQDRARARDAHIADSLAALEVEAIRTAGTIADIGSGAGFPGLALAIALPLAAVRLIESRRRSCEFLVRACSVAGVANAAVVWTRVEEWTAGLGANDAVTARALAPQPVVLEYAAPLLRAGGVLVDWRGRRSHGEEAASLAAAAELGLELREIRHVTPFAAAADRHLHIFEKVAPTPARFPRRTGVGRKRPLGAAPSDRERG